MGAVLRTLAEIEAAGYALGQTFPPLTQEQADLVDAILAPYRRQLAQREPQAA
jgi:hypothetical protein